MKMPKFDKINKFEASMTSNCSGFVMNTEFTLLMHWHKNLNKSQNGC